ncbi:hypothetical protein PMG11_01906 [Penicillium brasilianum]|uniref:Uncharacterized protein n=1 Tax=Penicillium brasilianum TaxID=104259 RepID=A0A0F7TKW3_PENBI|nr:hypothetical protein PMG11_01906 [Penicillium brasilianum]
MPPHFSFSFLLSCQSTKGRIQERSRTVNNDPHMEQPRDRTTIVSEAEVSGDQLQDLQREAERYRRATIAFIESIRRCNDEELQDLLGSIRNSKSVAEAIHIFLDPEDR